MKYTPIVGGLLFFTIFSVSFAAQDNTVVPKEKGQAVVDAVFYRISSSDIFPDDKRFLKRVAYVESRFGEDPNTFRDDYFGGIWQVDQEAFVHTQNQSLVDANKYNKIKQFFNIDWLTIKWDDLLKPIYSGLAAALLVSTFPESIPETIGSQAQFWKTYYNTPAGNGSRQEFIDAIKELEGNSTCRAKINLVAVLDGSGSIGASDFLTAKKAVGELLTRFELNTTSMGLIVFSDYPTTIFPVQKFNSTDKILNLTNAAAYPDSGTNTHLAILSAMKMLQESSGNGTEENNAPVNIMIVFTDGKSNYADLTVDAANRAIAAGINNFAVGITKAISEIELLRIAGNDTDRVKTVDDFETLIELVYSLNQGACDVPVKPPLNSTIEDEVFPNEKRYFNYELNSEGIKVHLEKVSGDTIGYYSYTYKTPSSALNDGNITGEYGYILAPKNYTGSKPEVFIAVEGLGNGTNQFKFEADEDETLIEKGVGEIILDEVVLKIEASNMFTEDYRFLIRVAYVESKFGIDPNTYPNGYFGGIWQLDESPFLETKNAASHPNLLQQYAAIKENYGIDWNSVSWYDLLKPFYSGLAARLFVSNLPETIPDLMDSQAQYWKTYYNTPRGNGTVQQFIDAINELEGTNVVAPVSSAPKNFSKIFPYIALSLIPGLN